MERVTSKLILLSPLETWYVIKIVLNLNSNRWIFTVFSSFQLVLCKWDTPFLSDTRLYEWSFSCQWSVSCQLFSFNLAKNKQTFTTVGFCTLLSVWSKCFANWSEKFATQQKFAAPCCVRRRRAWHRVWPHLTQCLEASRHLGWSFEITVPLLSAWTCRLKISNGGGDTEFSQRKDILHEKWGIILQHCYYRLAINANLIYTLHTLCIEEYNKK